MPFNPPPDYWVEIPGGTFTTGLLPDEARRLAEQSAAWAHFIGPEPSINDWKNAARYFEIQERTGNVAWMTEYLLAHFPAREVELAPFAIARRPITVEQFQAFMAESDESEPDSFEHPANLAPDRPARGIAWPAALKLAAWAGARLPFEAEWERAARGAERRLFPWGNEFRPVGEWVFLSKAAVVPPLDPRTATPDGIEGMLNRSLEWCADLWELPAGLDPSRWNERSVGSGYRVTRGEEPGTAIPSALSRVPGWVACYDECDAGLRLVRADGRAIPVDPHLNRDDRAILEARAFEHKVVRPTFAELQGTRITESHTLLTHPGGYCPSDRAVQKLCSEVSRRSDCVRNGFESSPDRPSVYKYGLFFVARSTESFRRIPPEHGVFVWNIQYRFADDGRVRARPVVIYRMAFDKRIHVFEHRFRPDEPDTLIDEITPQLIQARIAEAFAFYDEHADDAASPF